MKIKFSEIEDAFEFIGCAGHGEHTRVMPQALLEQYDVLFPLFNES